MDEETRMIGRVTRCSTRGFVGAMRLPEPDVPVFGSFCWADAQGGESQVIGLVYDISIEDDEFARQMAIVEDLPPEQLQDSRSARSVPVEFSAIAVGYRTDGNYIQSLPPQPPMSFAPVNTMPAEEIRAFTERLEFLPILFEAGQIPSADLTVASLRLAADLQPESRRRAFLIQAGRTVAAWLGDDLGQTERLLSKLNPAPMR